MLRFDKDSTNYNFDLLPMGETFLIKNDDIVWYGMKVCYSCGAEPIYYIMDLSDEVGRLYSDVDMYNIVRLIELKVIEDEGEE